MGQLRLRKRQVHQEFSATIRPQRKPHNPKGLWALRLKSQYLQIVKPILNNQYIWTSGGFPHLVKIVKIKEKFNEAEAYPDGSESLGYTSYSVTIKFVDQNGNQNEFLTPWAQASFKPAY
jgi:hypothetical protein